MPKIKSIEKKNVVELREEINKALSKLGKKFGLDISTKGSISYNQMSGNGKFEFSVLDKGNSGMPMGKDQQNFENYKHRYELSDAKLGTEFSMSGERWKIYGCKPRSRNAILCEKLSTGELYKVSPREVKNALRLEGLLS